MAARGRTRPTNARQRSIDELEWLRFTVTNVAGQYGEAVETQSWNAFVVLDDFLSTESSAADWVRNGAAAWVQGLRAGAELVQGIRSTLSRSLSKPVRQSEVRPGHITFFVDRFTEATDPVATEIPVQMIRKVKISKNENGIPDICINLTLSSDGKTVFVALYNLTVPANTGPHVRAPRPLSENPTATLTWGKGTGTTIAIKKV